MRVCFLRRVFFCRTQWALLRLPNTYPTYTDLSFQILSLMILKIEFYFINVVVKSFCIVCVDCIIEGNTPRRVIVFGNMLKTKLFWMIWRTNIPFVDIEASWHCSINSHNSVNIIEWNCALSAPSCRCRCCCWPFLFISNQCWKIYESNHSQLSFVSANFHKLFAHKMRRYKCTRIHLEWRVFLFGGSEREFGACIFSAVWQRVEKGDSQKLIDINDAAK